MSDVETPGEQPRRGRTVPSGALVLAIMVAAAMAILAVAALAADGGVGSDGGDADVRLAAGRFAERFLTFDATAIDDWREDIRALSTVGFADEVDSVQEGLRRLIAEADLEASAEVTEIFVGEVDRGAAAVVVIYDRQLDSSSGPRQETDRYMQLALLRVDGEWLVDNVIDIATAGAAGTEPAAPVEPSEPVAPSDSPSDSPAPEGEPAPTSPPG